MTVAAVLLGDTGGALSADAAGDNAAAGASDAPAAQADARSAFADQASVDTESVSDVPAGDPDSESTDITVYEMIKDTVSSNPLAAAFVAAALAALIAAGGLRRWRRSR